MLSLLRRDPIRKALNVLISKPGISSQELADEMNISMAATHRHVGLLMEKGIVTRKPNGERGFAYTVKDEYYGPITEMIGRI